jgi:hypothetical protein
MKINIELYRVICRILIAYFVLFGSFNRVSGDVIPFPSTLDGANISLSSIGDAQTRGLLLGNGELQGLVYSSGNDVLITVLKNDIWDMRANTSGDGMMPIINMVTYTWPTSTTPSWDNYTYPCNTFACTIKLSGSTSITGALLDLRHANAKVATQGGDTITVRVLSKKNVFLIQSSRTVNLVGGGQAAGLSLPQAVSGTQGGCSYLKQSIPGDADASGMDIYVVFRSAVPRTIVSVVTSRDTSDALSAAVNHCNDVWNTTDSTLITEHENSWNQFWSKSGILLSDATLNAWWYRMVYYIGTWAKENANVVGLTAASPSGGGWHNSLKINYNTEQTYCAHAINNHGECFKPFVNCLKANWPRAQWFAKTNFYAGEGAFFHSDMWPFEPDPANCVTKNKHQIAYTPWGYTAGMIGHVAWNIWEYYKFEPDDAYLRSTLYPLLKDIAKFYCGFLEHCQNDVNGKKRYGPSFWPESGTPPQDNNSYDIVFTNYALKAAKTAAGILNTDAALITRIDSVLAILPPLEFTTDPSQGNGTVIAWWKNSGLHNRDNHGWSGLSAIWPTGMYNRWSSPADKGIALRTVNHTASITEYSNSSVCVPSAYSALGDTIAIANALIHLNDASGTYPQPNGLFFWKGHGNYISEQNAVSRLIAEFLVQSINDIICVFPCWYQKKDAQFSQLGASGGFLVSGKKIGGVIGPVTVFSKYGKQLRLAIPQDWRNISVVHNADTLSLTPNDSLIVAISTKPNETYQFIDYKYVTSSIGGNLKCMNQVSLSLWGHEISLLPDNIRQPVTIDVFRINGQRIFHIRTTASRLAAIDSPMRGRPGLYLVKYVIGTQNGKMRIVSF